jgi:hypothetical protein
MKKIFALVLVITFAVSINLSAFNDGEPVNTPAPVAIISGIVVDQMTGEALVGAAITIDGTDSKTYSDLEGKFNFCGLVQGTYTLKVDYISYKETTLKNVPVTGKEESSVEIAMSVNEY